MRLMSLYIVSGAWRGGDAEERATAGSSGARRVDKKQDEQFDPVWSLSCWGLGGTFKLSQADPRPL